MMNLALIYLFFVDSYDKFSEVESENINHQTNKMESSRTDYDDIRAHESYE